jgi:hypothetical protein
MATSFLPTVVQQARYQGEFMAARERDEAFTREGGTFFYAVDLSIVYFLSDPAKHALAEEGGRELGYAGIFDDDPIDQAGILAVALAEFLAQYLSANSPMLLIPPMDLRVLNRLDRLKGSAGSYRSSEQNSDTHKSEAERLLKQLSVNASIKEDKKISITTSLLKILYLESGEVSELEKLNVLLSNRKLVSTTAEFLHERDPKSPFFTMFSPNFENHEQDYLAYFPDWLERIDRRRWLAEFPARVLARLQTYNERLERRERLGRTGKASRLLFITGDKALLEAGRKVTYSNGETFTDRYIRHPRSFLSDLPLLQDEQLPAGEAAVALADSRQAEIGSTGQASDPRRHWLRLWPRHDDADSVSGNAAKIADELRSRWRNFLTPAVARYRATESLLRPSEDWRTDLANRVEGWQAAIENALKKSTARAWDNCFFVATRAHLFLGQNPNDQDSARDAPPIYLDAWPETSSLLSELLSWRSRRQFDVQKYEIGLQAIKDEVEDENYLYAYYLAHAALFAGRGEWSIAASVAEYACQHLRSMGPAFAEQANGREARYFEAVCRRHAARSPLDLIGLESLIEQAEQIALAELNNADIHERPRPDCITERFEGERYALRYSRLLFGRFLPTQTPGPNAGGGTAAEADFRKLGCDLEAFWVRLGDRVAKVRAEVGAEVPNSDQYRRHSALSRMSRRTALNILSLLALEKKRSKFSSAAQIEAYSYIKSLREGVGTDAKNSSLSRFAVMVADCVGARFDESPNERKLFRSKLDLEYNPKIIEEKVIVFPYDLARSKEMLKIALI